MNSSKTSSSGVGFCGILTAVFVALKLAGLIDWSWWWVLSPLWIDFILAILIVLIVELANTLSFFD